MKKIPSFKDNVPVTHATDHKNAPDNFFLIQEKNDDMRVLYCKKVPGGVISLHIPFEYEPFALIMATNLPVGRWDFEEEYPLQ